MSKIIFDFVGGDEEKNKRIEDAMQKELARLGTAGAEATRSRHRPRA